MKKQTEQAKTDVWSNAYTKTHFRARWRASHSVRTNIVVMPIKKTSTPSVATHQNWMDPAHRLKTDYCSLGIMKAYRVKTQPRQSNKRWGEMFYCHNHRKRECGIYISSRSKLMENQWAGCQILMSFSGHKIEMTAKSVFLSSGWQHSAAVKSNTVCLSCGVRLQSTHRHNASRPFCTNDPFYHRAPL